MGLFAEPNPLSVSVGYGGGGPKGTAPRLRKTSCRALAGGVYEVLLGKGAFPTFSHLPSQWALVSTEGPTRQSDGDLGICGVHSIAGQSPYSLGCLDGVVPAALHREIFPGPALSPGFQRRQIPGLHGLMRAGSSSCDGDASRGAGLRRAAGGRPARCFAPPRCRAQATSSGRRQLTPNLHQNGKERGKPQESSA